MQNKGKVVKKEVLQFRAESWFLLKMVQDYLIHVSLSSAGMKAPDQVEDGYFRLSTSTDLRLEGTEADNRDSWNITPLPTHQAI